MSGPPCNKVTSTVNLSEILLKKFPVPYFDKTITTLKSGIEIQFLLE